MSTQGCASPDQAVARSLPREQGRLRLRQLDACLEQLECAHERGDVTVPVPVALSVGRHVPAVSPSMPITYAIQLVMRAQEPHLAYSARGALGRPTRGLGELTARPTTVLGHESAALPCGGGRANVEPAGSTIPPDGPVAEIDPVGARDLTERIKTAAQTAGRLGSLLVEAHRRRAWSALGYSTWADYVRAEFHLSRSRSYELLDHGRVLQAMEAVGLSGIPDISPYAAAQIKPYLTEVTEKIRARSAGLAPEHVAEVAVEIVREVRSRIGEQRRTPERFGVLSTDASPAGADVATGRSPQNALRESRSVDLTRLYEAVRLLANMPSVTETVVLVSQDHSHDLAHLADAECWLAEFSQAWRTHASGELVDKPEAC